MTNARSHTALPTDYLPLTETDLTFLLELCTGRGGDGEAETTVSRQNGDAFYRFSTGKGADAAAILKRNPASVLGWKLWQVDEATFTVFLLLDPDEVRPPGLWVKPQRTEAQREALRQRGRHMAAARGVA